MLGMTPEQRDFVAVMTRVMSVFGWVFLVGWMLVCAVFAATVVWMLVTGGGDAMALPPLVAVVMLLAAVALAAGGFFFIRFWQRTVDRMRLEVSLAQTATPENTLESSSAADPATEQGQRAKTAAASRRMSISAHIGWQVGVSVLGMLAAGVAFFLIIPQMQLSPVMMGLALAGLGGAATTVPRMLMALLPARCPVCAGPAFCRGSRPIRFVCRSCGHEHDTGIAVRSGDHCP